MKEVLRLDSSDNVVIAIEGLSVGAKVEHFQATERIPRGHKVAVSAITKGERILKFGQVIGFASRDIRPGDWVHEQNCEMGEFVRSQSDDNVKVVQATSMLTENRTFRGYMRSNGEAGTRNYLAIMTSVNCAGSVARFIAQEIQTNDLLEKFPNIDGIVPLVHGTGCAIDGSGEGFDTLMRTQLGYASNPNFAAVLMVGLGCETFQIARFKKNYGISEGDDFRSMEIQESGGTRATVSRGVEIIMEMAIRANEFQRSDIPLDRLRIGLQCGGSDGYSGITANPALGRAVDKFVSHGATAILSETPEIFGAEHLLKARAEEPGVADKIDVLIDWWRDYAARNNGQLNNNPSAGNKMGGLTTILEKSLGAVAKSGSSPLREVYRYAELIRKPGLVFMDSPGYDPVSATGQIAAGANLIAFTTGRGSAYGSKPVPSIKIASNNFLYKKMTDDMDLNTGDILDGVSIEEKGDEIFENTLAVASGQRTKSEILGYGDAEFVPWQIGGVF
jgi:altronate hydrolase